MVEYGNGVGQATGAAVGQFISNTVHNISALPPTTLLLGFVVIVVAFLILKRAF